MTERNRARSSDRRGGGRRDRRPPLLRPAGPDAALLGARAPAHRGGVRGGLRLRRLVDPRLPGDPGVGHDPDARPQHGGDRPVPAAQDARPQLLRARPGHRRVVPRDPRYIAKKAEEYLRRPASPTPPTSGPRPSSTSSTTSASCRTSARRSTRSTRRGLVEHGRDEGPNLGYKPRYKEGYFPVPPMDHFQDLRSEMILTLERLASRSRSSTTRSAPPVRPRSTCGSTRCWRWPTS